MEKPRDRVKLIPWVTPTMNGQRSSRTGYTPHELFHGTPAWHFHAPYPESTDCSIGKWIDHMQTKADKARALVARVHRRENAKKNRSRLPTTFKEGDGVLIQHTRFPAWIGDKNDDVFFGPYQISSIDGSCITARCSPGLGGTLLCAPKQLRHFHDPEDFESYEEELKDEEVVALDQERAGEPAGLQDTPMEEMTKEEMEKGRYYNIQAVLDSKYRQRWHSFTLWEGYGREDITWEPTSAFIQPDGTINEVLVKYFTQNAMGDGLRQVETRASKKHSTSKLCISS